VLLLVYGVLKLDEPVEDAGDKGPLALSVLGDARCLAVKLLNL